MKPITTDGARARRAACLAAAVASATRRSASGWGMPALAADSTWLARVANDPNGPTLYGSTYNSSQPSGYYVYSPDNDGLAAAFNLAVGQVGGPVQSGNNWVVFRTIAREAPNFGDLARQQC